MSDDLDDIDAILERRGIPPTGPTDYAPSTVEEVVDPGFDPDNVDAFGELVLDSDLSVDEANEMLRFRREARARNVWIDKHRAHVLLLDLGKGRSSIAETLVSLIRSAGTNPPVRRQRDLPPPLRPSLRVPQAGSHVEGVVVTSAHQMRQFAAGQAIRKQIIRDADGLIIETIERAVQIEEISEYL